MNMYIYIFTRVLTLSRMNSSSFGEIFDCCQTLTTWRHDAPTTMICFSIPTRYCYSLYKSYQADRGGRRRLLWLTTQMKPWVDGGRTVEESNEYRCGMVVGSRSIHNEFFVPPMKRNLHHHHIGLGSWQLHFPNSLSCVFVGKQQRFVAQTANLTSHIPMFQKIK